jgi:perosamine synthetase
MVHGPRESAAIQGRALQHLNMQPLGTMPLAQAITERVRGVVGALQAALHEPTFQGNEWAYVKECLDSGWVSSVGSYVDQFERNLAAYTGAAHAVVVSNGTSGLQVALQLAGVQPGDEVLIPALSFVATANAVRHCGAWPHFVDVDNATLGLGVPELSDYLSSLLELRGNSRFNRKTGRRVAAIVPMHTFGHPVDMPALMALADRLGIAVVEDAAESLGSFIEGRHTGTFGLCGMLSFNGNKIVTTGGGGALITNDTQLAQRAKHLTTTAKRRHPWVFFHDEVAYNYRMPNLNAALGCAQLEQLPKFLQAKRILAQRYCNAFEDLAQVRVVLERPGTQVNYWLQTLLLEPDVADQRDAVLAATNDAGLMTRPVWELLNTLPMYCDCPSAPLPVAIDLARRIVNLPSSPHLVSGSTGA